eukprot:7435522-Pyramimonas_sp.AAC.1
MGPSDQSAPATHQPDAHQVQAGCALSLSLPPSPSLSICLTLTSSIHVYRCLRPRQIVQVSSCLLFALFLRGGRGEESKLAPLPPTGAQGRADISTSLVQDALQRALGDRGGDE